MFPAGSLNHAIVGPSAVHDPLLVRLKVAALIVLEGNTGLGEPVDGLLDVRPRGS